jgi:hypothetical protein
MWKNEFSKIRWKKVLKICLSAGVLTLIILVIFGRGPHHGAIAVSPKPWNAGAIKGRFVQLQVREIDRTKSAIVFYYDLENNTSTDYRLEDGPNLAFMRRWKPDGSLAAEPNIKLSEAAVLRAGTQTRTTLELVRPFTWPARMDAEATTEFRQFVVSAIENLDGFVLFDLAAHYRIEFPGTWQIPQSISTSPNPR